MKKLKKDKVYVLIDNEKDRDRAIEILTKAGEKMWDDEIAFNFNKDANYLVIYPDGEWLIDIDIVIDNRTQVTLDELERILMPKKQLTKKDLPIGTKVVPHDKTVKGCVNFDECDCWNTDKAQKQGFLYVSGYTTDGELKLNEYPNRIQGNFYKYSDVTLYEEQPKIKKSELLDRIEVQDKRIKQLEETLTNHLMSQITDINDEVTEIIIAEKPAFEVWKVYNDGLAMFYCTRIEDGKPFGFGFDFWGKWVEDNKYSWDSDTFTEATHEEWFNRLEEYAKQKYHKGVLVDNEKINGTFFQNRLNELCSHIGRNILIGVTIMKDGKWAEIIEEQQYQAGTLGAFWDGEFDECLEKGTVLFGVLDHITENGHFRRKGASWSWYNFKPLKFD
jgi:hypothetical protein